MIQWWLKDMVIRYIFMKVSYNNIKITTPEDLELGRQILEDINKFYILIGNDLILTVLHLMCILISNYKDYFI